MNFFSLKLKRKTLCLIIFHLVLHVNLLIIFLSNSGFCRIDRSRWNPSCLFFLRKAHLCCSFPIHWVSGKVNNFLKISFESLSSNFWRRFLFACLFIYTFLWKVNVFKDIIENFDYLVFKSFKNLLIEISD